MTGSAVPNDLIGDSWPRVSPGADPVLYGHATLTPLGAFEVRSFQTFTLSYTAGRFGIDDSGAIKVVFRFSVDWGTFQTTEPEKPNHVTARSSRGVGLEVRFGKHAHPRPWFQALSVRVGGGFLREGDRIDITLGDRSGGSPGLALQTFVESALEFRVLVDVCATGHFIPIPNAPSITVVPGPAHAWKALLPTLRRPGETFSLGLKAEDRWGNPTDQASARLALRASLPVHGLPEFIDYGPGEFSRRIGGLTVGEPGVLRIEVRDERERLLVESNPLVVRDEPDGRFWADMHGQSGESIGINTAREYFTFARDLAFLDLASHQANDFQVNNAFWRHLNELTAEFCDEHRFVTFPGYEWSGNTGVGGDRNVYFRAEGQQIHRSSHALLPERDDMDTDANDAGVLFEKLKERDAVAYAHVGGRWADVHFAHDPRIETAMEIHSAWGTFEWLLLDALEDGHRVGVVCNSDGHKGRPGASYPGTSGFHAYGGLTCFIAPELTRDAIFECLRRRHHYGTTGNRLHLDVRAHFAVEAQLYPRDPMVESVAPLRVHEAIMGDIVKSDAGEVELSVEVVSTTPIEGVEIRNGPETLEVHRPYTVDELGRRIRIIWSGAERRGRQAATRWEGAVRFSDARIESFAKINAWNPERLFEQRSDREIVWATTTSGNFGGCDVWLIDDRKGRMEVDTNHGKLCLDLAEVAREPHRAELGGLDRAVSASRLPDHSVHREMSFTTSVALHEGRDDPIWVCVTTEDGYQAWSSPIYLI